MKGISATMWRDGTPQTLTPEQEALKRDIYEKMNPRRRKYIERIGYNNWDPFQKPNDPMELRTDVSRRTTQQLIREFLQTVDGPVNNEFAQGALESAVGIINRDEKTLGRYAFCVWYYDLLRREGHILDSDGNTIAHQDTDCS